MAPLRPSLSVEVEVPGRPLLEPQAVVVGCVLEELRGLLEYLVAAGLGLAFGRVRVLLVEFNVEFLGRLSEVRRMLLGRPDVRCGVGRRSGSWDWLLANLGLGLGRVGSGLWLVRIVERGLCGNDGLLQLVSTWRLRRWRLVVALDGAGVRRQILSRCVLGFGQSVFI